MGAKTKIEWTDATWNPVRAMNRRTKKVGWHCAHVTEACRNCYAEAFNLRFGTGLAYKPGHLRRDVKVFLDERMLLAPIKWKKPRRIFVHSMTDTFGDFVTDDWIAQLYAVMALTPRHTYQILTKRPARMAALTASPDFTSKVAAAIRALDPSAILEDFIWPLPNIWHGVSVCDQADADASLPHLARAHVYKSFVSYEPALGYIDFTPWIHRLDLIIFGGESGAKARPVNPEWARYLRNLCKTVGCAFFLKQWGEWRPPKRGEAYDTSKGRASRPPAFLVAFDGTVHCFDFTILPENGPEKPMIRVGKKAAGALLDGRAHKELPL